MRKYKDKSEGESTLFRPILFELLSCRSFPSTSIRRFFCYGANFSGREPIVSWRSMDAGANNGANRQFWMLKVALLFLRIYPLLAKTRIFFIGNVEHGEIFSKILFVQRDKFCKYLIWYRVEMLSREESYAKRIELVMSFVYCAISLLFGLDRMKSKIGLEIERN